MSKIACVISLLLASTVHSIAANGTISITANGVTESDIAYVRAFFGWKATLPESACVARIFDRKARWISFIRIGGDGHYRGRNEGIAVDTVLTLPARYNKAIIAVLPQSGTAYPGGGFVYNWSIGKQYKYPPYPAQVRVDGIGVIVEDNENGTDRFDEYVRTQSPFVQTALPDGIQNECDAGLVKCPCIAN